MKRGGEGAEDVTFSNNRDVGVMTMAAVVAVKKGGTGNSSTGVDEKIGGGGRGRDQLIRLNDSKVKRSETKMLEERKPPRKEVTSCRNRT